MTTVKRIHILPDRWFECEEHRSEDLIEDCLDDDNLRDTLRRFSEGMTSAKELVYEIQLIMEANYTRRYNPPKEELED